MDIISRYLAQLRTQIANLTMSQRLTIGLLVVVMIGTIYLVVLNSAKPEMDELLPGVHSSPEEIAQMTSYLKGSKYTYQVQGDKVLVPTEQAYQIRGELAAAQALPKNTTAAFAKLADSNGDLLASDASVERRWNYAREQVLAKVIRNFPYISDATVIVAKGERAGLGRDATPSSAMVNVRLKAADALTNNQVMAIVETVRGAIAGMRRDQVHVTDGARAYTLPSDDVPMAVGLQDFKKNAERDLTEKLLQQLDLIPNVKVAVNVVPNWAHTVSKIKTVDKAGTVAIATRETSRDSTTTEASSSGQPGVVPNTSISVGGSGGSRAGSNTSESTTDKIVEIPGTIKDVVEQPGAKIDKLTASIVIPRSYLVGLHRREQNDPKAEPKDDMVDQVFARAQKKIEAQAMNAIGADKPEQISVAWFDDGLAGTVQATGMPGSMLASTSGTNYGALIGQYGKQAVLGSIALGALMMMLMMVRKATPAAAGADADAGFFLGVGGAKRPKKDPQTLDVDEDVIGEAGQGEAVLTGIELDDETLQSRKMVDEVSTMIKENPENAASLVKRWITKNK